MKRTSGFWRRSLALGAGLCSTSVWAAAAFPLPTVHAGDRVVVRTARERLVGTVVAVERDHFVFQTFGRRYDTANLTDIVACELISSAQPGGSAGPGKPAQPTGSEKSAVATQRVEPERTDSGPADRLRPAASEPGQKPVQGQKDYLAARAILSGMGYTIMDSTPPFRGDGPAPSVVVCRHQGDEGWQRWAVADVLKTFGPGPDGAQARDPNPVFEHAITGTESTIVLVNQGRHAFTVTLLDGPRGKRVLVPAASTVPVPTGAGHYALFLVSAAEPTTRYQGDSFSVAKGDRRTLTFGAAGGNAPLRRVN